MIQTFVELHDQLSDLHETSGAPTQEVMHERFNHVTELENFVSRDDPGFNRWADTRIDRWLVDWGLRNGKEHMARKLAEDKNIEVFFLSAVDLCLY